METAVDYAEKVPDGRPKSSPVHLVEAGKEPLCFTAHFHGWRPIPTEVDGALESVRDALAKFSQKYSFDDLVNKRYPAGIDTTKLEDYLIEDEFITVFGVTREEFAKQPGWKQQKEKRDRRLF
jgi:advillin